jgi:hypothetical protein
VNIILNFHDAFPTSLSELIFDVQQQAVNYITATVVMTYSFFEIEQVNSAAQSPAEMAIWPVQTTAQAQYAPSGGEEIVT